MENSTIITGIITSGATIITVLITATVTIRSNAKARKHDHKLSILKVLLEAGYKSYELRTKLILEEAKDKKQETKNFLSFTEYIIYYRKMADVFSQEKVTENDIVQALKENKKLIDTYYIEREVYRPDYHQQNKRADNKKP
jgi:hypothetical protein